MPKLRTMFYLSFWAIVLAALARVYWQTAPANANTVVQDISNIDNGEIVLTVSATGAIRANQETPLAFLGIGKIVAVNVKEGDHVLAGQTLAILDTAAQQEQLRTAQLALEQQRVAFRALTSAPRDVDLNAAQAALKASAAQVAAANIGSDSIQIKIAKLQVELSKNAAWQSQLNRDNAVSITNQAQPAELAALYAQIWSLPEDQRNQVLAIIGPLTSGVSAAASSFIVPPAQAEGQVKTAGAAVDAAQANADRIATTAGNQGQIAQAQLAVVQAQTAIEKLLNGVTPETLAIAKAQIEAAQTALDLAQYSLTRGTLTAPFDGVIAKVNVTTGEPVPLNQPAVIIVDNSAFYVDVPIDEADIARIREGQAVSLNLDALPGQLITGKVTRVATTSLDAGGVITYLVRVKVENTAVRLRSGMTTTATITIDQIDGIVRVRNRFVRLDRKTGKATVTVQQQDGTFVDVEIKLGLRNETYSEVKAGLKVGDVVVIKPRAFTGF